MSTRNPSPLPSVGFLTVVDDGSGCLLGGYLVVNASGRPLEFQCTAPVKANRAQEILYGPTLKPYLWGEQIGGALISKSRSRPLFVCTNQLDTFAVRTAVEVPVLQITQHEMTQPWLRWVPIGITRESNPPRSNSRWDPTRAAFRAPIRAIDGPSKQPGRRI